ncbi:MAG: hypothetical protein HYX32_07085 [Actinobacteria bacterium]|nr:hypothetical protein [Actinomycetota bacterium]
MSNPYHYTDNDPLNKTDPMGTRPTDPGRLREYLNAVFCINMNSTAPELAPEKLMLIQDCIQERVPERAASSDAGRLQFLAGLVIGVSMSAGFIPSIEGGLSGGSPGGVAGIVGLDSAAAQELLDMLSVNVGADVELPTPIEVIQRDEKKRKARETRSADLWDSTRTLLNLH